MCSAESSERARAGLVGRSCHNEVSQQGICWHLDHSFWVEKFGFIVPIRYKGNEDTLHIRGERNDRGEPEEAKNHRHEVRFITVVV